jgi:cytochrome P450
MDYVVESVSGWIEFAKFRRDRLAYVGEAGRRGVDVRRLEFAGRRVFQINHPDLIRDVLITRASNFVKGPGLQASKPLLGEGLLTSEGELHRKQRRLVQPAFHSSRLAGYAQTMVRCASVTRDCWADGQVLDIHTEMMQLTLEIVGLTLFSADLRQDAIGIGKSLTRALEAFQLINGPWAQLFPFLRKRSVAKALAERRNLEGVLGDVIERHRRNPEAFDDMLSMLLESGEDGVAPMSQTLLLDEALTLFLAGHETTANAMTWAWFLLAQHPDAQARMQAEIHNVLEGRLPTMADLPLLSFTNQVFRETLRLFPPAWIIGRQSLTSFTLGGVDVPSESTVIMSPYSMQRDARFWKSPDEFIPERWSEADPDRPKFAFFPFGAGARLCIGEQFALMEGVLLLATLAQRWKLHLEPGQRVVPYPRITLRPSGPVRFRLEKSPSHTSTAQ